MIHALTLRELTLEDVPVLADLTQQLGYEVTRETLRSRLEDLFTEPGNFLRGAVAGGVLVGFMHCFDRPTLEKGRALVVQALVVDERVRGTGAGTALLCEAERLAAELGCEAVTLSSNERRRAAHAFYEGRGYDRGSRSYFFLKASGT